MLRVIALVIIAASAATGAYLIATDDDGRECYPIGQTREYEAPRDDAPFVMRDAVVCRYEEDEIDLPPFPSPPFTPPPVSIETVGPPWSPGR